MRIQNDQRKSNNSARQSQPFAIRHKPLAKAIALALSLSVSTAHAANINVNSNLDTSGDGNICTLRDAVISANTNTATGGCAAGSGIDVIDLSAIAEEAVTLTHTSGELAVTSAITVEGSGVSISGNNTFGIWDVYGSNANLTLNNLSVIDGNGENGGGIHVENLATLTLNHSTISGNSTNGQGGGLFVTHSSTATLNNSTVSGNTANYGGGLMAIELSTVHLYNSTISGNKANNYGGGVNSYKSYVSFLHSTVTGNTITAAGPFNEGGGVFLQVSNFIGGMSFANSIIANSVGGADCDGPSNYISASGVNNIIDQGSCQIPAGPGLITTNPNLGSLSANGGPTMTHALPDVSVARNAATDCMGVTLDQRGYARQGPACDLGAYDFEAIPVQAGPSFVVSSANDIDDGNCAPLPDHCSLREAIDAANANVDASIITFDNSLLGANPATITLAGTQLPEVTSDITIQGAGITVDGDGKSGLFKLNGYSATSILTIDSMTLSGGFASYGGGVLARYGVINLTNSTVSGNSATFNGGGIHAYRATVNQVNSTVSGNSASVRGGGVYVTDGTVNLTNSTVSGNWTAQGGGFFAIRSTVNLSNSLIANSVGNGDCNQIESIFTTAGANLIESKGNCTFSGPAPITNTDPLLGPLVDNGGPTLTHLPMPGSPVIDAGVNSAVPVGLAFDQRGTGFPRIQNGTVDLGAVEVQPVPQNGPDFVVTAADDSSNDGICALSPDHCNLREALMAANANADASTITFANSLLGANPATITLEGTQLPKVTTVITIQGAGITVDGDGQSRLFEAQGSSTNLTIDSMTLSGGSAFSGGGVLANGTTVNLTNSTVSGNSANYGGGVHAKSIGATVNLTNSTVTGNSAGVMGGGVYATRGTVNLTDSTVSGNSAVDGGGFAARYGTVNLTNSTVSGNSAGLKGGGVYALQGFAAFNSNTLNLTDSTVSGNSAGLKGGGVYAIRGTLNLTNSIIANSIGTDDCGFYFNNGLSDVITFTTNGANLIENIGNCSVDSGPAPITNTDPLLGPLADNGGPTLTHQPLPGSPVIDAGVNSAVPVGLEFDQRGTGFPRIINDTVDLGSFEFAPLPEVIFCDSFENPSSCALPKP